MNLEENGKMDAMWMKIEEYQKRMKIGEVEILK